MVDGGVIEDDGDQPRGAGDAPARPDEPDETQHQRPQLFVFGDVRAGQVQHGGAQRRRQHPDGHQDELPLVVAPVDDDGAQDDGADELGQHQANAPSLLLEPSEWRCRPPTECEEGHRDVGEDVGGEAYAAVGEAVANYLPVGLGDELPVAVA
ncbi:hypothetical protein GP486_008251, partial [Trichoglossum hirsutum]